MTSQSCFSLLSYINLLYSPIALKVTGYRERPFLFNLYHTLVPPPGLLHGTHSSGRTHTPLTFSHWVTVKLETASKISNYWKRIQYFIHNPKFSSIKNKSPFANPCQCQTLNDLEVCFKFSKYFFLIMFYNLLVNFC